MEQITGHWRKLKNPKFLGSWDLQRQDESYFETVVTILKVDSVETYNSSKKENEMCVLVHTKETKPFICNVGNAKAISSLAGSEMVAKWIGTRITLYVKKERGIDCIRVKPIAPKSTPSSSDKENLNPQHEKWEGAKSALQSGATTIDAIKKAYNLSAENEGLLKGDSHAE